MQFSITQRPFDLENIVGHENVKKAIKSYVKDKQFSKVIHLNGFPGLGKDTFANIIAMLINCQHIENNNPCGKCSSCLSVINEDYSGNIQRLDASKLNTEGVRELSREASLKAFDRKDKVYIIGEFQELLKNSVALNNLLTLFESQKGKSHFILTSMGDVDLPVAFKRRAITYKLHQLKVEDISYYLFDICKRNKILIDTEEKQNALVVIAENCQGSPGLALSYLETIFRIDSWKEEDIVRELGIISNKSLLKISKAILDGNASIFSQELNKELLEKLKYQFLTLYRHLAGEELQPWQNNQIKEISKTSLDKVQNTIDVLSELNKYPYLDKFLIQTHLIKAMLKNKQPSRGR